MSQGTLKRLRDDLFTHMESLPIRYFDTHSHGNIMSIYTNDIDTLRQMISQSIPQLFSSAIMIVSVFGQHDHAEYSADGTDGIDDFPDAAGDKTDFCKEFQILYSPAEEHWFPEGYIEEMNGRQNGGQ